MNEEQRQRLIALLRERSFERKQVRLASGKESDFFIDCKQTALTAEGHFLIGELLFAALDQLPRCEAVAAVALGGCSLASAVSLISFQKQRPLPALYIRKAQKDHGSQRLIEGDRSLRPGLPVVLLEDVITTGGSTCQALRVLRDAGVQPVGVIVLVDRQEGGRAAIEAEGIPLIAVSQRQDYIPDA
jgi:orotate phosphoribosyltransferase